MVRDPSRTVVHLSDLHFGRVDPRVVRGLHDVTWELMPDVVAISGDLTQRARRSQFERARGFIDGLPAAHLVVPGNHDIPLFNLFARWWDPLGGYTRSITRDLNPTVSDDVVWITGVDTTRPSKWKSGRLDAPLVHRLHEEIRMAPAGAVKVLVAHHPFDAPDTGQASAALEALTSAGIDVFLTGHLHTSYAGHTAHRYKAQGRTAVVVEAATATSTRRRNEPNGFNVLRISPGAIHVETFAWDGRGFVPAATERFGRSGDGWNTMS